MRYNNNYTDIIYETHYSRLNHVQQNMLMEAGMIGDIVRQALHYFAGAAVEYGMAATIAGAPAAPACETLVDGLFAVEKIQAATAAVSAIQSGFKNGKEVFTPILALAKAGLSIGYRAFYDSILAIWKNVGTYAPKIMDKIDEVIEKIKEEIKSVIDNIAGAIGEAIQLVIPDATVGAIAAKAVSFAISKLTENCYNLFTNSIGKIGILSSFILTKGKAAETFSTIFDEFIGMLKSVETGIENSDEKILDKVASAGWIGLILGPLGAVVGRMASGGAAQALKVPAVANKVGETMGSMIDFVESKKGPMLSAIEAVFDIVLPILLALLASHQILMKGQWKSVAKGLKGNVAKGAAKRDAAAAPGSPPSPAASPPPAPAVNSPGSAGGPPNESMIYEGAVYNSKRLKLLAGIK